MTDPQHPDAPADVVGRLYALADEGDFDAMRSLIADDAVSPPIKPHWWSLRLVGGRGDDMLAVGLLALRDRLRLTETIAYGDRVFAALSPREPAAEDVFFSVLEVHDGLVVSIEDFGQRDEALRAAELTP